MPTSTVENYLKAIQRLGSGNGPEAWVGLGRIAGELSVTPGTVTSMMKHLAGRGLVDYRMRAGVRLTRKGETEALNVVRRHRLIELFLVKVLGMDWADVHAEAEALEHAVSDKLLARMDEILGNPSEDPHGEPIPTADGVIAAVETLALSQCDPGAYRLVRVDGDEVGFLHWLKEHDLLPGAKLHLKAVDPFAGIAVIARDARGAPIRIGLTSAERLRVVPATTAKTRAPKRAK